MPQTITRRNMLVGGITAGAVALLPARVATALDFGTVFGGLGAALFPSAAFGLASFALIKTLGNVNGLIGQTQALESHIDDVLTQVKSILTNIQTIVADCVTVMQDIESLVANLPSELSTAINDAQARLTFANLQGDVANMSACLQSRGSIIAKQSDINALNQKIVKDISQLSSLQSNPIQFAIQVIPALSTWVHGYTALNMLVAPASRQTNPWDHDVVKVMTLPRIQNLITLVNQRKQAQSDLSSIFPMSNDLVYQFDGTNFTRTTIPFALTYPSGTMNGNFYVIWPSSFPATSQSLGLPPTTWIPPGMLNQRYGDFCVLLDAPQGSPLPRAWGTLPVPDVPGAPNGFASDIKAGLVAQAAYLKMNTSIVSQIVSFDRVTDGFGVFQDSVQANLVVGNRDSWANMPILTP